MYKYIHTRYNTYKVNKASAKHPIGSCLPGMVLDVGPYLGLARLHAMLSAVVCEVVCKVYQFFIHREGLYQLCQKPDS